jgi:hypothetical protein
LDRNADVVQSFDKQFVAPSTTSTKTKFPNRGWFGKMEASSANNLLKQETGRNHDLRSYRNSALAARARYMIRKTFPLAVPLYADFETEGAVVAKCIQNTYPNVKIGVLNDVHHPPRNNAMNRHGQSDRLLVRLRRWPPRTDAIYLDGQI